MTYKYDVALSFAGEDRDFAEAVATMLRSQDVEVFYDEFNAAELWGKDLPVEFRKKYSTDSRYCIIVLSDYYLKKVWTIWELRNAIEKSIQEKGEEYILPVRLDGFSGEVPGLLDTIGYVSAKSTEPEKVVDLFLQKIGRKKQDEGRKLNKSNLSKSYIPKLGRSFSDQEKKKFLRESFEHIVSAIGGFAGETKNEYPNFEFEVENITTRKVLFTLYNNGSILTNLKIWINGGMGRDEIWMLHGTRIDVNEDKSTNEMIYVEEHEGELKLKPMGMLAFTHNVDFMSPQETAEYIWKAICSKFSY
ncbi:MAG: TIR domain-containing protein [Candidatus Dadabacteria bacterium]|nr:TIR domain-containing protein [Candidatus Dadabacteria bacterium]